jgi:hypothetical protein
LDAVHRVAAARFDDYQRKLTKVRAEEWQRLTAQHSIFWHWIHHASRVTEEQWSQDVEQWIRIYKEVSGEFGRPELLQKEHLDRLRADVMIRIDWACQGLEHQIQMAANAQSYIGELPGPSHYDVYIRGRVLNVIITSLELLEAEGEAARVGKDDPATPTQAALEPVAPRATVTIREPAGETRTSASAEGVDLSSVDGRRSAVARWKEYWHASDRECTDEDLTEKAYGSRDRSFLNQWINGTMRLKNPQNSDRVQAIEGALRTNTPPVWHPAHPARRHSH